MENEQLKILFNTSRISNKEASETLGYYSPWVVIGFRHSVSVKVVQFRQVVHDIL